jgi:hypothetical protein
MMLDTSAYHGPSFGQQQLGQPFGQGFGQQLGQPYGQAFGQQPFGQVFGQLGQPYGPSFGQQQPFGQAFNQQPYGQAFGQQLGQPFGLLSAVLPQLALQSTVGGFGAGAGWPGSLPGYGVPLPLALQSLCAQLTPLAALQSGAGVPNGPSQLGTLGSPLGTALGQQHGYPIGPAIWGWPAHPAVPIGFGINPVAIGLQGLPAQMAMGNSAITFGPRMIGGLGAPGIGIAPVLAGAPPLAYAG